MLTYLLSFIGLSLLALIALTRMIVLIGSMQRECPETGTAARLVAVTVATGFCAIGAGGVFLIAAAFPLLAQVPMMAFFVGLGLAVLCLGLGFSHAVNTLRLMLYRSNVLAEN
ncbi:hypothetical protein [Roseovarius atlanticus]|uniref:hypothetical protein n=1 Tax=Roseovarius atlanticus TaxID=1641875 RepID=UPI001C93CEBF|nr:hypothetical protein [Roseovarius atlanticus]MBY5986528.1 hypothetical protein [Roseovarius atlanticus]MBY6125168.1 hypothetical protein [Roseovarius atlanticus]MBY6150371.1 hypothetical protein [Roseovarius atlanticus]